MFKDMVPILVIDHAMSNAFTRFLTFRVLFTVDLRSGSRRVVCIALSSRSSSLHLHGVFAFITGSWLIVGDASELITLSRLANSPSLKGRRLTILHAGALR
jgi:hypothetical protein